MAAYVVTPAGREDLLKIDQYLCRQSVQAADSVSQDIEHAFELLATQPLLGHVRPDLTNRPFRFWTCRDYLIVYDPATAPVRMIRVLHSARDVASLLR